jgi:hypothetical protein
MNVPLVIRPPFRRPVPRVVTIPDPMPCHAHVDLSALRKHIQEVQSEAEKIQHRESHRD